MFVGNVDFLNSCNSNVFGKVEWGVVFFYYMMYIEVEFLFDIVFMEDGECVIVLWGKFMVIIYLFWFGGFME